MSELIPSIVCFAMVAWGYYLGHRDGRRKATIEMIARMGCVKCKENKP